MTSIADRTNSRPAWFVGAFTTYDGTCGDHTERYLREGIWVNGYTDGEYFDRVNDIRPGDRIAIKSVYVRSDPDGLPFDNRGNAVSVMAIKAIGTVTENLGDGRTLRVDRCPVEPPREWYFSTYLQTVHRVNPDNWKKANLIAFTFDNQPQDIDQFRNDPQFKAKFGNGNSTHLPGPPNQPIPPEPSATYTIDSILADGCFLPHPILEAMLRRLRTKQNLILQGPPGTGKTWLAKKLAYALIGRKDDGKVRPLQFHPNLSYEDFVRGWRPQGNGQLALVDGPFLQVAEEAREHPGNDYVMVIEEINRGNPASIFGEMLTLLEADKRSPDEALALAYPREADERVHIPPNVYVIGTMNLADRSLAMVDLALRRRFAFFDLEAMLNDTWREWVQEQCGIEGTFLDTIAQRVNSLNEEIATDRNLGRRFRIGHSFVTPAPGASIEDPDEWFEQVVETEIVPLLHEYWFDDPNKVYGARSSLLSGL